MPQKVCNRDFPGSSVVKNLPVSTGDVGSIPGPGRSPHAVEQLIPWLTTTVEKALATHSSTLAWKISWLEEPDRLQFSGSLRVGHD